MPKRDPKKHLPPEPYKIVYEDEDLVAVSKPPGLLSVPIPKSSAPNLLDMLRRDLASQSTAILVVHRIDRYTSGIVVFAKNKSTRYELVRQFRAHEPVREYLALVRGTLAKKEGILVHHLKLVKKGFRNISVSPKDPDSTQAKLRYVVHEQYPEAALVGVQLITGLKNQIRVQFAEIGNPIIGDRHYKEKELQEPLINRQALHAWRVSLIHPKQKKRVTFEAPLPSDMTRLIKGYKK